MTNGSEERKDDLDCGFAFYAPFHVPDAIAESNNGPFFNDFAATHAVGVGLIVNVRIHGVCVDVNRKEEGEKKGGLKESGDW